MRDRSSTSWPPADADVAWLLAKIADRVTALLRRRGRLDGQDESPPDDDLPLLAALPAQRRSSVEEAATAVRPA